MRFLQNRGDYSSFVHGRLARSICCTIVVMDGNQKQPAAGQAQPVTTPAQTPSAYNPPSLQEPGTMMPSLPNVAPATVTPAPVAPTPAPVQESAPVASAQVSVSPQQTTSEAAVPSAEVSPAPAPVETGSFYHAGSDDEADMAASQAPSPYQEAEPVEWVSGNESFRAHAGNWRLKMSLVAIIGGALVFLVTRSYSSAGAVVVVGVLFGVLGARPPRPINYRLDGRGISVGSRQFSYAEFRAFSVSDTSPTVNLVPLKRFAPIMVLRLDPTVAADVVKALSSHLPMETPRQDAVDSLVSRLRI